MGRNLRLTIRAGLFASLASFSCQSVEADHVLVRADDPRDPPTKIEGTIVERTGAGVTIETAPGRTQQIPAERIVGLEATKSEKQQQAEALLRDKKFSEAFTALVDAEASEPRDWVKREILALASIARSELGDRRGAAKFGIYLLQNDPATPHAGALPLVWRDEPLGVPERDAAKEWFDTGSEPAQLLAASWLLAEPETGAAAQAKLTSLAGSIDVLVATLAKLQLARRDATPRPDELATLIDKLPTDAKAGPYWLLGREYERAGQSDEARIAYLRSGLGYDYPRELVASALVAAVRLDSPQAPLPANERARLLQFAVDKGGDTTSGREARALLDAIRREATGSR